MSTMQGKRSQGYIWQKDYTKKDVFYISYERHVQNNEKYPAVLQSHLQKHQKLHSHTVSSLRDSDSSSTTMIVEDESALFLIFKSRGLIHSWVFPDFKKKKK